MAKEKKPAKYVFRQNPTELDLMLYRRYDSRFLLNKVIALEHATGRSEDFQAQLNTREELKPYPIDERYFDALRAEIYFTEFHQFEAFFALLIAPFQGMAHWIYLTEYPPGDIRTAARLFLDGDFTELTKGAFNNVQDLLKFAVYTGSVAADPDLHARWDDNIANLSWLIQRMAQRYLHNLTAYNGYKHGLRVMTGQSGVHFAAETSPGVPGELIDSFVSPDSLGFLLLEDIGEGGKTVHLVTRHFDIGASIFYITRMSTVTEVIRNTRLAGLEGGRIVDALHTFYQVDRQQIVALENARKFDMKWTF